ncbi:MAG: hydrogenase maturation protease [Planctomycetota bacterium]
MNRIICVGNRYVAQDAAGPMVYDRLTRRELPCDVEVIDGGLAGLDLLRFLPGAERVVFVDAVFGSDQPDGVVVLDAGDAAKHADAAYDHSAGLAYLLRVLPQVCEAKMPEVLLVGVQGVPDQSTIAAAADMSLTIAAQGHVGDSSTKVTLTGVGE